MVNDRTAVPAEDGDPRITLGLLAAVEADDTVTQRSIAGQLGVALGLVNAYLKRCVTKGWVKVRQAPANRYAYYLTPKGFREKSRLTAEYLRQSFSLFRQAREQYAELVAECEARGFRRVAFVGASDLTEVARLFATPERLEVAGVVDPHAGIDRIADLPVVADLAALGPLDAVLVTDMHDPEAAYAAVCRALGTDRVLAPELLQIGGPRPRRR